MFRAGCKAEKLDFESEMAAAEKLLKSVAENIETWFATAEKLRKPDHAIRILKTWKIHSIPVQNYVLRELVSEFGPGNIGSTGEGFYFLDPRGGFEDLSDAVDPENDPFNAVYDEE